MSKITGKKLLKLGFKKVEPVPDPEEKAYHYFVYEVNDKCLLISCSNDEKIEGSYEVEFYEIPDLKFRELKHLKNFIELINEVSNG